MLGTVEVTAGVVFRYSGHSLVWYDEVATILLAAFGAHGTIWLVVPGITAALGCAASVGIALTDRPAFSVQHHPEASPGPQDSHYLFTRTRLVMPITRAGSWITSRIPLSSASGW